MTNGDFRKLTAAAMARGAAAAGPLITLLGTLAVLASCAGPEPSPAAADRSPAADRSAPGDLALDGPGEDGGIYDLRRASDRPAPGDLPPPPCGKRGALIGVSRWDVWVGALGYPGFQHGVWNEQALSPTAWHDRLPFYGRVLGANKIEARFTSQAVMDQEIAHAKCIIDYWAFLDYPSWEPTWPMHTALSLYLSSKHKRDVNFTIIMSGHGWWNHKDVYLDYFSEPSYQRVLSGRPLVYLNLISVQTEEQLAAKAPIKAQLAELTAQSVAQGRGKPYYVVLMFYPQLAAKAVDLLGVDAVSSYAKPKNGDGQPYASYATYVESSWEGYRATGKKVVPVCMVGWDQRPRAQTPVNPTWQEFKDDPGWYKKATAAEVAAHLRQGILWNRSHPGAAQAQTILAYSWNEFSEGGWLCPTLTASGGADASRLTAIRAMRKEFDPVN